MWKILFASCKRKGEGVTCEPMEMNVERKGHVLTGSCIANKRDEIEFNMWFYSKINSLPSTVQALIGMFVHLSDDNRELQIEISTRKDA